MTFGPSAGFGPSSSSAMTFGPSAGFGPSSGSAVTFGPEGLFNLFRLNSSKSLGILKLADYHDPQLYEISLLLQTANCVAC